jgi:hypothetical protein
MSEYIKRIEIESEQLNQKIKDLETFIETDGGVFDSLGKKQNRLLMMQLGSMQSYSVILAARLQDIRNSEVK